MTFAGTVKAFQADKGFGFITTDDGLDLFVHSKACTDGKTLQVGDKVMFDLEDSKTKPGEYVAGNVSGGTGSPAGGAWGGGGGGGSWGAAAGGSWGGGGGASWGGAVKGTGQYTGTVKTFTPDKGFGFVSATDGTDYFFHQKQFVDGSAPAQGDVLTFDLEPSPLKPGQFQGSNITGGSQAGPKGKGKGGGKGKGKDGGKGKGKGGGKGGGAPPGMPEANKIFVGGLKKTTTEDAIMAFFSQFGAVSNVMLKYDEMGGSKGFAFVSFGDAAAQQAVIANYDNNQIEGKWVEVKVATAQAKGGGDKGGKGGKGAPKGGKGWAPY